MLIIIVLAVYPTPYGWLLPSREAAMRRDGFDLVYLESESDTIGTYIAFEYNEVAFGSHCGPDGNFLMFEDKYDNWLKHPMGDDDCNWETHEQNLRSMTNILVNDRNLPAWLRDFMIQQENGVNVFQKIMQAQRYLEQPSTLEWLFTNLIR